MSNRTRREWLRVAATVGIAGIAGCSDSSQGNGTQTTDQEPTATAVSHGDLVAHWAFDNSSAGGTVVDSSGSHVGAITNAQRVTRQSRTGLEFGENSVVKTEYTGVLGQAPRTVSFWAKTVEDRWMEVCTYGENQAGSAFRMGLNGRPGGEGPSQGVTVDCGFGAVTYEAETADDQWHHYAFVVPEIETPAISDVLVYQDGELLENVGVEYNRNRIIETTEGQPVWFGSWHGNNRDYIGILDDVRVYSAQIDSQTLYEDTR